MNSETSVRMWCGEMAALPEDERLPLSELTDESHIHGGLRLEIAGRRVPHMGCWSPEDVCFDDWLEELRQASRCLAVVGGRHVFDEGEQGQPAFLFERDGQWGYFSIVASGISGAQGDPDWQRVRFAPADFVVAFETFRLAFVALLRDPDDLRAPHRVDPA